MRLPMLPPRARARLTILRPPTWLNGNRARELAGKLGPGLITGAADDDPSGLAT